MRRLRLVLWRYWTLAVCAVAITAAGAVMPPRAPSHAPAINVVLPDNPAPLVELEPGCFLERSACAALTLPG